MKYTAALMASLLLCFNVWSQQDHKALYAKKWLVRGSDSLGYRLLLPENYNPQEAHPLVLFLHGAGERGSDNEAQLVHGSKLFASAEVRKKYPAIVVFPQCPREDYWPRVERKAKAAGGSDFYFPDHAPPGKSMTMVMALVEQLQQDFKINPDQLYCMGLSMGGMGTFELMSHMPNTFAAAIPICGGGSKANALVGSKPNYWIFHGDSDAVVPVSLSDEMVEALRSVKPEAEVRYTVYKGVNHNSWDNAFAEPELLAWLFSQRKKK